MESCPRILSSTLPPSSSVISPQQPEGPKDPYYVVQAGDSLDATMLYNAKAPDGSTATFSVSASGMIVPPLK